jgi:hypothetical protein
METRWRFADDLERPVRRRDAPWRPAVATRRRDAPSGRAVGTRRRDAPSGPVLALFCRVRWLRCSIDARRHHPNMAPTSGRVVGSMSAQVPPDRRATSRQLAPGRAGSSGRRVDRVEPKSSAAGQRRTDRRCDRVPDSAAARHPAGGSTRRRRSSECWRSVRWDTRYRPTRGPHIGRMSRSRSTDVVGPPWRACSDRVVVDPAGRNWQRSRGDHRGSRRAAAATPASSTPVPPSGLRSASRFRCQMVPIRRIRVRPSAQTCTRRASERSARHPTRRREQLDRLASSPGASDARTVHL